jgi:hypothetical protein
MGQSSRKTPGYGSAAEINHARALRNAMIASAAATPV